MQPGNGGAFVAILWDKMPVMLPLKQLGALRQRALPLKMTTGDPQESLSSNVSRVYET